MSPVLDLHEMSKYPARALVGLAAVTFLILFLGRPLPVYAQTAKGPELRQSPAENGGESKSDYAQFVREILDRAEKEMLWVKDYKSLPIVIEDIPTNNIGVTKDAVQTKTELRLRQAGIRPLDAIAEAGAAGRLVAA